MKTRIIYHKSELYTNGAGVWWFEKLVNGVWFLICSGTLCECITAQNVFEKDPTEPGLSVRIYNAIHN